MSSFNSKEIKKLSSYYDRKLRECHKYSFNAVDNNLDYFVTYLKFLRDYFLLTTPAEQQKKQPLKITSLVAAVGEYEKYSSCIFNYYKVNDKDEITEIQTDMDKKEVAAAYWKERNEHWGNFWQLIMLNIESWTANA